jgi:hypothetical protein
MNYSNANVYIKDAAFGSAFVDIDPSGANNTIRYFSDEDFSIVYHESNESLSGAYNENLRDFVYPSLSMDVAEGDFNVHAANYSSIYFSGLRLFTDDDGYSNSGCSGFYDFYDMDDGYVSGIYTNKQLLTWRHRNGDFFLDYLLYNYGNSLIDEGNSVDASGQGLDTGVHWDSVSGYNDTNGMAFFYLESGYDVLQESHELGYERPVIKAQQYFDVFGQYVVDSRYDYYFGNSENISNDYFSIKNYKVGDKVELNLSNSWFDTFDNRENQDSVINFSPAYNSAFSKTNGYPFLYCIKSHSASGISTDISLADPRINYGLDANVREYWKLCFRLPMKYSEDLFVPFVLDSPQKKKVFIYGMDEFNDPNKYRHYIPDVKSYHYYNSGTGGNSQFFIIGAQTTNSSSPTPEIVTYDWRPYEFPASSGLNGTLITGLIDYESAVDPLGGSLINHYYINYQYSGVVALNYYQQPSSPRKLTSTNDVLDNRQWGYSFTQIMSGANVTWSGSKTHASLISGSTGRLAIADTKYAEISIINAVTGAPKIKIYANNYYTAAFVDINSTGKYGLFRHGGTGTPANGLLPSQANVGLNLYQAKNYTRDTFNWADTPTAWPENLNYQANYVVVSRHADATYKKVFYFERNDGLLLTTISNGGSLGYRTGDSYILELSKTNVTDPNNPFWENPSYAYMAYLSPPLINKLDINTGDYNDIGTWYYSEQQPRSIKVQRNSDNAGNYVFSADNSLVIKDENLYRVKQDIANIYDFDYIPRKDSQYWDLVGPSTSFLRSEKSEYEKSYWKYVKRLPIKASEMPVMLGITGTGNGSFLRDPSIYHFQVYSGHYYYTGGLIFQATKDICWVPNTPITNLITGYSNNYQAGNNTFWNATASLGWQESVLVKNAEDTIVSTEGTFLEAKRFGTTTNVTINGVTFTGTIFGNQQATQIIDGGTATTELKSLYNNFSYYGGGTGPTISGLISGQTYMLQWFFGDERGGGIESRSQLVTIGGYSKTFPAILKAKATKLYFVATSTSALINIGGDEYGTIEAYQIRNVSPPLVTASQPFSYDLDYDKRAAKFDFGNSNQILSVAYSGQAVEANRIYALNFWCKFNSGNFNSPINAGLFDGTILSDYKNQLVSGEWRHVILTGLQANTTSRSGVYLYTGSSAISLSFADVRFGKSTYGAGSEFEIMPTSIEDNFIFTNVVNDQSSKLGRFLTSDFGQLEKSIVLYKTGNLSGADAGGVSNTNYLRYFADTRNCQSWNTGNASYGSYKIGNEKFYPSIPLTNQSTTPIISGVKTTANDIINKFTLLNEQYGSKSFFTYGPEESYKNYLYPEYISENIKYFMSVSGIGNTSGAISAISGDLIDSSFNFLPASNVSISNQTQSVPRRMLGNRSEEENQYAYFGPLNQAINLDCYLSTYHAESFNLLMSATGDNLYHLKVGKNIYKNCYLNSLTLNIEPFKPVKASASFNSISSPFKRVKGLRKEDPINLPINYGSSLVYGQNCLISPSANQFIGSSKSLINYSVVCSRSVSNSIGTFEPQRVFLESVEKELVISSNDFTYFIDFSGQKIEEEIKIRMFSPTYGYLDSFQLNAGSMLVAQRYSIQAGDVAKIDISFKELVL